MFIARLLSYLFHPVWAPTLGFTVLVNIDPYLKHTLTFPFKRLLLIVLFTHTCLLPVLFTLLLKRKRFVSSLEMAHRRERLLPFAFTVVFFGFAFWMVFRSPAPLLIVQMFAGMALSVLLLLAGTFLGKPSAHSAAWAALFTTLLVLQLRWGTDTGFFLPLFVCIWAVAASARLWLKSHSHLEIVWGAATGIAPMWLALWFWR